jgi:hypothetical protein
VHVFGVDLAIGVADRLDANENPLDDLATPLFDGRQEIVVRGSLRLDDPSSPVTAPAQTMNRRGDVGPCRKRTEDRRLPFLVSRELANDFASPRL